MGRINDIVDKLMEGIDKKQLESFITYQLENGIEEDDITKKFNTFLRDNITLMKYGETPFGKPDDFEVREYDVHTEVINPEKRTYEAKLPSNVEVIDKPDGFWIEEDSMEEISNILEEKIEEVKQKEPKNRKRTIKVK